MNLKERITDSINNHEYRELQTDLATAKEENKRLREALELVSTKHGLLTGLLEYPLCRCKPGQLCMKHAAKDILVDIEQALKQPDKESDIEV